jgi:hypothetical protein
MIFLEEKQKVVELSFIQLMLIKLGIHMMIKTKISVIIRANSICPPIGNKNMGSVFLNNVKSWIEK